MMLIRAARTDDLDAIMAIEQSAFDPSRRASRRSLLRALVSPRQRVLVCERRGQVVGYAILWCFVHTWRLYSIATAPASQGSGSGTRLLEAAIAAARSGGAHWLQLEARPVTGLLTWYSRHGFRTLQELPDYYAPGEPAVRMRMALRE